MHEQWAEKFWARVKKAEPEDGCWEWTGSRLPSGYGRFYPAWKVGLYAHRVSWEMANGREIPYGLEVLHACDNPSCVRPDHLSVGTRSDNMQDMLAKGRGGDVGSPGERHPHRKLTAGQVREIRARWKAGGIRQQELADEFGVTKTNIGLIVRRVAWKSVEEQTAPDAKIAKYARGTER